MSMLMNVNVCSVNLHTPVEPLEGGKVQQRAERWTVPQPDGSDSLSQSSLLPPEVIALFTQRSHSTVTMWTLYYVGFAFLYKTTQHWHNATLVYDFRQHACLKSGLLGHPVAQWVELACHVQKQFPCRSGCRFDSSLQPFAACHPLSLHLLTLNLSCPIKVLKSPKNNLKKKSGMWQQH